MAACSGRAADGAELGARRVSAEIGCSGRTTRGDVWGLGGLKTNAARPNPQPGKRRFRSEVSHGLPHTNV